MAVLRVTGSDATTAFANESGGFRFQRVPPTEKRGRMQTSTITVAVLPEPAEHELVLHDSDLDVKCVRGSGKGGQARNKTSNAVQVKHLPTGLMVRVESERSQASNKAAAYSLLRAKLLDLKVSAEDTKRTKYRKQQIGTGMRGDKVRTYRYQDDRAVDHRTGKKASLKRILDGFLEDLA